MNPRITRTGPHPYQDPTLVHLGLSRDEVLRMTGHQAEGAPKPVQRHRGKLPIPRERLERMRGLLGLGISCRCAAELCDAPVGSAHYMKRLLGL